MKGIQYIKNAKGETTHLVANWNEYGELFEQFLEEQEDETFSFEEVRKIGLEKGIPDGKLAK